MIKQEEGAESSVRNSVLLNALNKPSHFDDIM